MKLIWHIIKKDIVRDRWALLMWAALFVAQVVIGVVLLNEAGNDRDWIMKLQVANGVVVFVEFLAGYVLVARLVHADVLFGTDMFWATRPISRGRLLAAKAGAALLVFGLLPVALLTPWWVGCGFTARDLFWTAVETFGWQLLMIAPAFLIASLTNELGRVLLWTMVLFIAGMLWVVVLGNFFQTVRISGDEPTWAYFGKIYTGVWLACLLFVICSAGIAAHQYLTQRLARSIGLTIAGAGLVVATGLFNPLDWSLTLADLPRAAPSPEVVAELAAVKAEAGVSMSGEGRSKNVLKQSLITEVYFQGLPEHMLIDSGVSRQTWRWDNGPRVSRWGNVGGTGANAWSLLRRTYDLKEPVADQETVAWRKARQEEFNENLDARLRARGLPPVGPRVTRRLVPPSRPGIRAFAYANVPGAMIERAQIEPPAYETELRCAVAQAGILADLPIRAGAAGGANSVRARLQWIGEPVGEEEYTGVSTSILVTAPAMRVNGLWLVSAMVRGSRNNLSGEILTVNHATGDMRSSGHYSLQSTRQAIVGGVNLSWDQDRVRTALVVRDGKWTFQDPQWIEHSSIILLTQEIVGRVTMRAKEDRMAFRSSLYLEQAESEPLASD